MEAQRQKKKVPSDIFTSRGQTGPRGEVSLAQLETLQDTGLSLLLFQEQAEYHMKPHVMKTCLPPLAKSLCPQFCLSPVDSDPRPECCLVSKGILANMMPTQSLGPHSINPGPTPTFQLGVLGSRGTGQSV